MSAKFWIARRQLAFPVLRCVLDEGLLRLIAGAEDEFKAANAWMDSRDCMITPLVQRKHLVRLRNALFELWPAFANLRHDQAAWARLKGLAGLRASGCEVCGHGGAAPLHVMHPPGGGGGNKPWSLLWDHPATTLLVCGRMRQEVESAPERAPLRGRLASLVEGRARLNAMLKGEVRGEIDRIRAALRESRKAWRDLESCALHKTAALALAIRKLK